ncbi:hypothetical protein HUN01_32340 [Nostoc edaphicum CCNP1411]|uniref:Uncharacterized protein n=1 Tax=Nostoc edaphicum CCNP1411 TaxID=1472755 RepID=A0A7D7QRJ3_9NOSO|nr:hypothetical protein [Nostoc edaphicum]QMS92065.1 hypothetical protein HUN01_32340 [Nostoc edaphicum CCNP1411]
MANLSNWQDSLDEGLVNRLHRPLRQPGMMKMAMSQRIINRCDRFLNRLPLLNQQMQRWGNTNTLSSEPMPIVYAQPVSLAKEQEVENRVHNSLPTVSQVEPSPNVIQRKIDSSQSLPIRTVSNTIPTQNITDLSISNFTDDTTQSFTLETPINKTLTSSSEVSVVSPQPIAEQLPKIAEMALVDLTNSQTSLPNSAESNLNHPSQTIVDSISFSSSEIPIVSPQSIAEQLPQTAEMLSSQEFPSLPDVTLPIIQAKLQIDSRSQPSLPIVNDLNNLADQQETQADNYGDNISLVKHENLIYQISSKQLPIVTAQPLTPQVNLNKQKISFAINSPTFQNQPATTLNKQPVTISTPQINQSNHKQNISPLPVVSVTSPSNPSLKTESLPLPIAKATPSSKSNSQQSNLPNRNSISNTDSSSPPRSFTSPVLPTETSVSPIATQSNIDVDAIASQVERKLMRRLVIESERRGKNRWH